MNQGLDRSPVASVFSCALALTAVLQVKAPPGGSAAPLDRAPPVSDARASPTQCFPGFVENDGQWDSSARFIADDGDLIVRAEPGAITVQREIFTDGHPRCGVVRLVFDGRDSVEPRSGDRASGERHYFVGSDPAQWRRHVPAYSDVIYPDILPGTDVRLYRSHGGFEYDFHFSPSADVSQLVLRCEGVDELAVEANGDLRMDTPLGPLIQRAPIAWQITPSGQTIPTTCGFRVIDAHRIGFTASQRLAGASLVIDPGLSWATFLGGSAADWPERVRVLESGDLLVVGESRSPDFPATAGVFDSTPAAQDVTVSCLDPTGSQLVFSTLLGGSGNEQGLACDVAANGDIAIGGWTDSADFPTLATSYDQSLGGNADAFVAMLTSDGSDLAFSTFLGGNGGCSERVAGLALTSSGSIVAAGWTCDAVVGFPVTPGAFDTTPGGTFSFDGFVSCFDPTRSGSAQLVYSTFLGGSLEDKVWDVAMGSGDEPIVVGDSSSADFPTTSGAYDETPGGQFITRLAANGASLVASTRFKGGHPRTVATDDESVLIAGLSNFSDNLPVSAGAFDTTWNGKSDGFIARLDDQLSAVLAATYIGGSQDETVTGLTVDETGNIVIVGVTSSGNYPTTPGAYDTVYEGGLGWGTSMVSYLSADLSDLLYSSYLGPAMPAISLANDVAAVGPADVVIVGEGAQIGFPVTPGAFDETFNGGDLGGADGYVARMLLKSPAWISLGGGVGGSNGLPTLAGSGTLVGGQPVALALTGGKPVTAATLIVGLSALNAPFKAGTLVPFPSLLIFGLATNAHGSLTLNATWPNGLPSGFTFFTQYWIPDSAGPAGFAASNGLAGTTP
jgi:hypothetical protein